ncbi:putative phage abortive infection protein [Bacillus halotolerans]|uniref:putative phage abortive infection protein n=1 Tax=Bacillus halotolerans TaxID=260554 RepID=UPI00192CA4AA|nr:putative phage abortive infection protein [Bacillus halotolerans]MBL4974829.1 putative phage abortive infection protein [Bacillus halotolerans]
MSENEKKDKWYGNENFWMWAGITACGLALIIPFAILLFTNNFSLEGINGLGTFGDFFGGTTVGLFNLSSILLVLTAVIMQRKELEQTRNEFVQTNKTLIKQQFDNTFFNMINLHNEIVRTTNIGETIGKSVFKNILNNINRRFKGSNKSYESLLDSYEYYYSNYDYIFGHYFRNMYRIVKFIDEADLDLNEKKNYIGILRAQLSTSELSLVFYNALSDKGDKFRKLIQKHEFFDDHLNDQEIYHQFKHFFASR